MDTNFAAKFPKLGSIADKITSEQDSKYNCIAWAFKNNRRWWWPSKRAFWPRKYNGMSPIEAFEDLFEQEGWEETTNLEFDELYEKIAIYTKNGQPTHAARLIRGGKWTSKLGQSFDIVHELHELEGPEYGTVWKVFDKKL